MEERTPTTADVPAGAQVPLPFDDESEWPIEFALTARARRRVAPDAQPPLRVVLPTPPVEEDPSDTRPARARALRRAGVARDVIATQIGADELLVRAWTGGVVQARATTRSMSNAGAARRSMPAPLVDGSSAIAVAVDDTQRAQARVVASRRLRAEPALAGGLGLLAGVADLDDGAVTVTTADPRVAGAIVAWLVDALGADRSEVRLVLRVGPRAAADLARHRWGQAVGLAPDRVRTTRAGAPAGDADVEGVLRVGGVDLAAAAAGWCDALLDGVEEADDTF